MSVLGKVQRALALRDSGALTRKVLTWFFFLRFFFLLSRSLPSLRSLCGSTAEAKIRSAKKRTAHGQTRQSSAGQLHRSVPSHQLLNPPMTSCWGHFVFLFFSVLCRTCGNLQQKLRLRCSDKHSDRDSLITIVSWVDQWWRPLVARLQAGGAPPRGRLTCSTGVSPPGGATQTFKQQ